MVETEWLNVSYEMCKTLASRGDDEARFWLGHFHWTGRGGIFRDTREALRIWKSGRMVGNYKIQYMIAVCHKKGLAGIKKDKVQGQRLQRLAAEGLLGEAVRGDQVSEQFYLKWMSAQAISHTGTTQPNGRLQFSSSRSHAQDAS